MAAGAGMLDIPRLKTMILAHWLQGGLHTLVKVMPRGSVPDPTRMIGYCTTFGAIVGRTPIEMEATVGFAPNTKLVHGAEVFLVRPLPRADQFQLRGYSQTPAGVSTGDPSYVPHPDYPPGLGVPQWDLDGHAQSALRHLARVDPGQKFTFVVGTLPNPV